MLSCGAVMNTRVYSSKDSRQFAIMHRQLGQKSKLRASVVFNNEERFSQPQPRLRSVNHHARRATSTTNHFIVENGSKCPFPMHPTFFVNSPKRYLAGSRGRRFSSYKNGIENPIYNMKAILLIGSSSPIPLDRGILRL